MTEDLGELKRPLTRQEQEAYAAESYDWVVRLLKSRLGPEGEDYAGLALWEAILCFDGSCPLRPWILRKVVWLARDAMRKDRGRVGSEKYEALMQQGHLIEGSVGEDDRQSDLLDHTRPEQDMMDDEQWIGILNSMDELTGLVRWVILGRLLGEFNDQQLETMLGVRRTQIRNSMHQFQRSLQYA